MSFGVLLNQVVQGVLLGGLYTLFAIGLSLSVGVMRFVNIAHGDLIVLASFAILGLSEALGVSPFVAAALVLPCAFAVGYGLQRFLLQRMVGEGILSVVLVTFGLSVIIQNGLLAGYGPDTRKLAVPGLETASLHLGGGIAVGVFPLMTFAAAVALILALDLLLYRSPVGARIRAVADDVRSADLIGLSSRSVYAVAMGLVGVTVAVAACFMAIWSSFDPSAGPSRLLSAFEAVVLGGLGSLWGTLAGGILLALAQSAGAQIDPAWELLSGHLLFLVVLMVRPQGLVPRN